MRLHLLALLDHYHANLSNSSIKQVNCVGGTAGIEPTPSKSNNWTQLLPCQLGQGGGHIYQVGHDYSQYSIFSIFSMFSMFSMFSIFSIFSILSCNMQIMKIMPIKTFHIHEKSGIVGKYAVWDLTKLSLHNCSQLHIWSRYCRYTICRYTIHLQHSSMQTSQPLQSSLYISLTLLVTFQSKQLKQWHRENASGWDMRYVMKKSDQTVQNKKWCVACVDGKNSRLSSKTPLHATDPGPATENQSCCCIILPLLGMLLQCISCSGDAIHDTAVLRGDVQQKLQHKFWHCLRQTLVCLFLTLQLSPVSSVGRAQGS